MDANCRSINIVLNDNKVEQMFEYFGDGVGDTKVQIVKEETDGKVLMEIMVVSEAIQTILRREKYPQPYEALKALTRRISHKRL